MGKLLTLASSRDLIEDCMEEQKAAKQDLREIRAEQHRREREEAAHRYTHRVHRYTHCALMACGRMLNQNLRLLKGSSS